MQRYIPKEHEWFFVHLYNILLKTGDLERLFLPPLRSLTAFLGVFADPNCVTWFEHDSKGVWFVGWFQPLASGVTFSLWVRADRRHSPRGLRNLNVIYDNALKTVPVIVGITRQPELEEMHLKLGYHKAGVVPGLLDGSDAHIFAMTRLSRADVKVLSYGRVRQLVRGENHATTME